MMLNCRQATRLISQAMDTTLPWHRRLAVRLHLLYCVWCRRYARQLQVVRQAAGHLPPDEVALASEKLSPEAKELMRTRLQEALKGLPPASQ